MDEDLAIMESKISPIKDLFPNYGKGFISACLEVYNQNPEEVIQRILEETLHGELQLRDTSMEEIPPNASSVSRHDKGKGKLLDSAAAPTSTSMALVVGNQQTGGPQISSSSSAVGTCVRKSTIDLPDSQTLNSRDEKDSVKTAALVSQLEYEDEYMTIPLMIEVQVLLIQDMRILSYLVQAQFQILQTVSGVHTRSPNTLSKMVRTTATKLQAQLQLQIITKLQLFIKSRKIQSMA